VGADVTQVISKQMCTWQAAVQSLLWKYEITRNVAIIAMYCHLGRPMR